MIVCGIDPGLDGAVAFLNIPKGTLEVFDMPTVTVLRGGKKKREVSASMFADLFSVHMNSEIKVFSERVNAMKGQGVTSVFSFGRSSGIIEGVIAARLMPLTLVTPQTWQKACNVRDGKDGSRARAAELYPAYARLFARKCDDGRSDASLIAYYGAQL
jgi:crossover junction endodeoxyribonuclease RuvC